MSQEREQEIAFAVRRSLDEGAARLPYRTAERLARAREAALARMPAAAAAVAPAQAATEVTLVLAPGGGHGLPDADKAPALVWRILAILIPALIIALGFVGIDEWAEWQRADEAAEIDEAVLLDDVPIDAYTDRGFGVFLKNDKQ